MQPTKDSFYIALRDRLVAVDPNRTVTLDGATRPAIAVIENEPPSGAPLLCDAFYLHWGNARPAALSAGSLMEMDCTISYCTKGTSRTAAWIAGAIWRAWTTICWPCAGHRRRRSAITVRARRCRWGQQFSGRGRC